MVTVLVIQTVLEFLTCFSMAQVSEISQFSIKINSICQPGKGELSYFLNFAGI